MLVIALVETLGMLGAFSAALKDLPFYEDNP
jgi:hypothetical protein